MVTVRSGLTASAGVVGALLTTLSLAVHLGLIGWVVGLAASALLCATVFRAATGAAVRRVGPADLVTLLRASLTCACAALVADTAAPPRAGAPLVVLAAVALVLDLVDGPVARWTASASSFGARLDGEADAALMLLLSAALVGPVGAWVLAIGGVRYAFGLAGHVLPWLRGALPFRYWRKVVTATSGVALVLALARVLPGGVSVGALALAGVLLAESFGRDVWWLWRHRVEPVALTAAADVLATPRR